MSEDKPGKGAAFVKGGFGCLIPFICLGLLALLLGGSFYINIGGVVFLFAIGGFVGLIILWIYNKGRRDAGRR
jgi:hypothetical protein